MGRRLKVIEIAALLPPCKECGACCVPEYDDGYYADVNDGDEERMGRARLRRMTLEVGHGYTGSGRAMQTKENAQGHIVCKALRGSVGKRCSCSIYRHRPDVCREFNRGSEGCLAARRQVGLSGGAT